MLGQITWNEVIAQKVQPVEEVLAFMEQTSISFYKTPVSFDIVYRYSNEHTPAQVLDSAKGRVEMAGKNYRCVLENTETVRNERYCIILYNEDKLMYLAKSPEDSTTEDPLAMMRSLLKKDDVAKPVSHLVRTGKLKTVQLDFPAGSVCKQISMTVDTLSNQLVAMHYIIKTSQLTEMPSAAEGNMPEYEEYALVSATFYNYRIGNIDNSKFDERTYFYKEGNEFKATEAFSQFKLFLGSPYL